MKSMETGRQDGGSDKNHAPFSVGKTGNISRKFLTIILKIFDKNFERLHLDYIDSHYTEELTLDNIADFSGFSKYHFTRLFKQYTDSTFYDYLIYRRIKAAEELLANPELSITEIALQSGFSSISTFNRIFKQKKGCTPSEYRSLYSMNRHL